MSEPLPEYRVLALNTDLDHENKAHGDFAAQFGFVSGLVPGVNIYGYLTVPVVREYGSAWLNRGWMRLRLIKPFYDGEEVVVCASRHAEGIAIDAARASAEASVHDEAPPLPIFDHPLPAERPAPSSDNIYPGAMLGSFTKNLQEAQNRIVDALQDPNDYSILAHPTVLLSLSNEILVKNFVLPFWIHTSSEVRTYRAARADETVTVCGRIRDAFPDKGHEYLIAETSVVDQEGILLQHVTHVAIWKFRDK